MIKKQNILPIIAESPKQIAESPKQKAESTFSKLLSTFSFQLSALRQLSVKRAFSLVLSALVAFCFVFSAFSLISCNSDDFAGEDIHLSNQEISVTTSLDKAQAATRASLYDNDNLTAARMKLYVYYTDTKAEYFDTGVLYDDDNAWKFYSATDNIKGLKYFWPTSGTLDFFAHFPENLTGTGVTMTSTADDNLKLSYEGTSPITEANQSSLKEFIFAYDKGCEPGSNGIVNLAFHRPFSLVAFKLNESIRCTIASIKITGIYNNGTATLSNNAAEHYAAWTTTGDLANIEIDYTAMDAYKDVGIRYPGDINSGTDLCTPFICVPQTIPDDAKIEVTYKAVGSANNTTVKSTLKAATLANNSAVTVWKPGNRYDYSLTLNGAANEIFVAVSVNDWEIEGTSESEVK